MVSWRILFPFLGVSLTFAAVIAACGDDPASPLPADDGGAASSSSSSGGSSSSSSGSGSSSGDPSDGGGGDDGSCAENPVAPDLDGTETCKTLPFGQPAVPFGPIVDASDTGDYVGGTILPGIYDAVIYERGSDLVGTWRETFVVGDDNRFTRVREGEYGPSDRPRRYASGTLSTDAAQVTFTFDCEYEDDAAVTGNPTDNHPYEVIQRCGETYFRYGAAGFRVWLKRR